MAWRWWARAWGPRPHRYRRAGEGAAAGRAGAAVLLTVRVFPPQTDGAAGAATGLPPGAGAARGAPCSRSAARPAAPPPQPLPAAAAPRRPPLAAAPGQAAALRGGGKRLPRAGGCRVRPGRGSGVGREPRGGGRLRGGTPVCQRCLSSRSRAGVAQGGATGNGV